MPHIGQQIRTPKMLAASTSAGQLPQLNMNLAAPRSNKPKIAKTNKVNKSGSFMGVPKISLRRWDVDPAEIAATFGITK